VPIARLGYFPRALQADAFVCGLIDRRILALARMTSGMGLDSNSCRWMLVDDTIIQKAAISNDVRPFIFLH